MATARSSAPRQSNISTASNNASAPALSTQSITPPTNGGGSLKSIGEKFQTNPTSGTCSLSIPLHVTPGRQGFTPDLSLSYDSGVGNGAFGLGWSLGLPQVTRKTATGLPRYNESAKDGGSDTFLLSGVEDLVPKLGDGGQGNYVETKRSDFIVRQYCPRTEIVFDLIEQWTKPGNPAATFWRTISASNMTTYYGQTTESRIVNPIDNSQIFSWLISAVHDSHGNAAVYTYKVEDSVGIALDQAQEAHRTQQTRSANRYIKSIKYGNRQPNRDAEWKIQDVADGEWLFEVVFDYGDHSVASSAKPDRTWGTRKDCFSSYLAGWEVRTYRLCQRILMFHHMKEELGVDDCLVRSTDLVYDETASMSYVTAITQSGHAQLPVGNNSAFPKYSTKTLPPIKFEYSRLDLEMISVETVSTTGEETLDNLPFETTGDGYQWIDLDGVGKPSAIYAHGTGWYQKQNWSVKDVSYHSGALSLSSKSDGDVLLGGAEPLPLIPSTQGTFTDVDGNGKIDFLSNTPGAYGFYERIDAGGWTEFRTFAAWPTVNINGANLRFLDITGDGLADIIISEADTFVWYPALGTRGYGEGVRMNTGLEDGPRLLFTDGAETVYLADFTGDGLTDLVRIRSGQVCYWPNLGYGRFGSKITMDNSPWLDALDPNNRGGRILLGDIDGSGVADMLYFAPEGGLQLYFNQAGNSWASPAISIAFPEVDSLSSLAVLDLFGTGTSCLVWTTASPGRETSSVQYIDFMQGRKPHLLTSYTHGAMGTRMEYIPSTRFCQDDALSGRKWPTRLPFAVQCLASSTTWDGLSHRYHVTKFSYHDGYYDGIEREFRGFGKVVTVQQEYYLDETDNEFPDEAKVQLAMASLPRKSIAWYHTGTYTEATQLAQLYRSEYFDISWLVGECPSLQQLDLPLHEMRDLDVYQAYRSFKGRMLRKEVYQLDGTSKDAVPISITDQRHATTMLQGSSGSKQNRPGIFITTTSETLSVLLERDATDPRIKHEFILNINNFGQVTKLAQVNYGRRKNKAELGKGDLNTEDEQVLSRTSVLYVEHDYTNAIPEKEDETGDDYRLPMVAEERRYEATGLSPSSPFDIFSAADLAVSKMKNLKPLDYTLEADVSLSGLRLIANSQSRFRSNDLSRDLDKGVLESLALPGRKYTLDMTQDLVQKTYQSSSKMLLPDLELLTSTTGEGAGFVDLENDGSMWISSSVERMIPSLKATLNEELKAARASFFQPVLFSNNFGNVQTVVLDQYKLHLVSTTDAKNNTRSCKVDYRTLQPAVITDENGNKQTFVYDEMGDFLAMAVEGAKTGDTLDWFQTTWDQDKLGEVLQNDNDVVGQMVHLLGKSTSFCFTCFAKFVPGDGWLPAFQVQIQRANHVSDTSSTSSTSSQDGRKNIMAKYSYYDGSGHLMEHRELADSTASKLQWVSTGMTRVNSSGKPVRTREDVFADTHKFSQLDSSAATAPPSSVFSTNFYDASGRLVATVLPNGTWSKSVFKSWSESKYSPGNTTTVTNPMKDEDVGPYFVAGRGGEQGSFFNAPMYLAALTSSTSSSTSSFSPPSDATVQALRQQTSVYANTPTTTWFDARGHPYLVSIDNGTYGKRLTRTHHDIQGHVLTAHDSLNRLVNTSTYSMLGHVLSSSNMDTGSTWSLYDALGLSLCAWNTRGVRARKAFDELRRLIRTYITVSPDAEFVASVVEYGDDTTSPNQGFRNKVVRTRDQAKVSVVHEYDVQGNAIRGEQQLVHEYKKNTNWSHVEDVALETEVFQWAVVYDALGRVVVTTRADGSTVTNTYSQRGLLSGVAGSIPGTTGAASNTSVFIKSSEFNARGQRTVVYYGNGTKSEMQYDPLTAARISKSVLRAKGSSVVQTWHYTRDCMGRILQIEELADQSQSPEFSGKSTTPTSPLVVNYTYDATGRLLSATGREQLSQVGTIEVSMPYGQHTEAVGEEGPVETSSIARYLEEYTYDNEGNILKVDHNLPASNNNTKQIPGWTRSYTYHEPSALEPQTAMCNRLSAADIDAKSASLTKSTPTTTCMYQGLTGLAGYMTSMTGFSHLQWDPLGNMQASTTDKITTWYRYDMHNQRVRKITEKAGKKVADHIYLNDSAYELARQYGKPKEGGKPNFKSERISWHIKGNGTRIALIEGDRDVSHSDFTFRHPPVVRYSVSDHLSSTTLELDENARLLSLEEFAPYGSTTLYLTVPVAKQSIPKRYGFSGEEKDAETGLQAFDNRYLVVWLGRWLSPDPIGIGDGFNVYCYVGCDPVNRVDPTGLGGGEASDEAKKKPTWKDLSKEQLLLAFLAGNTANRVTINHISTVATFYQYAKGLPGGHMAPWINTLVDFRVSRMNPVITNFWLKQIPAAAAHIKLPRQVQVAYWVGGLAWTYMLIPRMFPNLPPFPTHVERAKEIHDRLGQPGQAHIDKALEAVNKHMNLLKGVANKPDAPQEHQSDLDKMQQRHQKEAPKPSEGESKRSSVKDLKDRI